MPFDVITDPPGASLYLDGQPVEVVALLPSDHGLHEVEARLGCLGAKKSIAGTDRQQTIHLKLEPGPYQLPVATQPSGASIFIDGQDTGLKTPSTLARSGCEPFKLELKLDGYVAYEASVDPRKETEVKAELAVQPPPGSLKVDGGSAIIQVYEGSRLLGASGQTIGLSAGEHTLRMVNVAVRGTRQVKVTIKPDATTKLKVAPFETGQVFLYAKPVNDGKVMVDGLYLEDLPLNGTTPLAVGRHQFQVISPQGRRVTFTWDIGSSDQTRIVDFETGKIETP